MDSVRIPPQVERFVTDWFESRGVEFVPGKTRIPLNVPSYGSAEVLSVLDSLLQTRTTMGPKVAQFEKDFASYLGVKHAVMVNSGSSANLVALSILTNPAFDGHLKPGDEVITPAVTWATTVYPILNMGLVPVLVDVRLDTFDILPQEIEKAITRRSKAILLVHLMGIPCDMDAIMAIARRHNLLVVEDTCEAHGAEYHGRKAGSIGDLGTFSFFFSHHITTMEGGMVVTNREDVVALARGLRAFGWIRDLPDRDELAKKYAEIDPRFLFVNIGYNLRPTELQGAFGIHQLPKLEGYIAIRRENARYWCNLLQEFSRYFVVPEEQPGTRYVWFGFPFTVRPDAPFTRKELMSFLESKGLETRPLAAGNIDQQPVMQLYSYRKEGDLPNARLIMSNSLFFGNHQGIGDQEREAIGDYLKEFLTTRRRG